MRILTEAVGGSRHRTVVWVVVHDAGVRDDVLDTTVELRSGSSSGGASWTIGQLAPGIGCAVP